VAKPVQKTEIEILKISTGVARFAIVGTSPLIFNRMSEKAKRSLLAPKGRMTAADKAGNIKHDPLEEYRASVYTDRSEDGPTRLMIPAPAFKGAMASTALDMPGAAKTEIGRLTWISGVAVPVWGIPQLRMDVVRMADASHTPDIRTRACLAQWAAVATVNFVQPKLTATAVFNLLAAAGLIRGVGDFRQEKGKGSYGQFRIADENDPEFKMVCKMGRKLQDSALSEPDFFDADSEELFTWHETEMRSRGRKAA
jgi:hypothetical protein